MSAMIGDVELEFPSEDRFSITMMGMPMEGNVKRSGNDITLTPDRIMGMSIEEFKKQQGNGTTSDEPLKLTMSADGKSMLAKPAKATETPMTFNRAPADKPIVSTLTSDDAKKLVGKWKGEIALPPAEGKMSDDEKAHRKMVEEMNKGISVELREDESFVMSVGVKVEGTWKLADGKLTLSAGKIGGMKLTPEDMKNPENKPLVGEVAPDGGTIVIKNPDPKQGVLTLKKA
jgi:hypothetical protein